VFRPGLANLDMMGNAGSWGFRKKVFCFDRRKVDLWATNAGSYGETLPTQNFAKERQKGGNRRMKALRAQLCGNNGSKGMRRDAGD